MFFQKDLPDQKTKRMEYWDTNFPPFQLAPTSSLLKVDYKEFLWAKMICFDGITKKPGAEENVPSRPSTTIKFQIVTLSYSSECTPLASPSTTV